MLNPRKKSDDLKGHSDRPTLHPGDKVPMSAGMKINPADVYQNLMMEKPVGELLSKSSLLTVQPADSVEKIVLLLQKKRQSSVLVVQHGQLLGIVSKRDLLHRTVGMETKLASLKALEVMTANPEIVKVSDPLAFAVNKMAMGGFRHLPVISEDGEPIGILSIQDVLSCLAQL
jgi:CBS domain-containing protein